MEENQKKSSKMPIISLIVIIAILLIIGWYYLNTIQKPKNIFTKSIETYLTSLQEEDVKTQNSTISLDFTINSEDETISNIAEYINKISLNANAQIDYDNQKEIIKLALDYDSEDLLDATIYYQNQEDNIYIYLQNIYDKYLYTELDSETKQEFLEIFEKSQQISSKDAEKISDIINEKISNRLSDDYFSQEDADIEINGENVNTKKSTLTLTGTQFKETFSGLIEDLENDEEFLSYFEDNAKDLLSESKTYIDDLELDDETIIKFNIYTKGIKPTFVKMEITISYDNEELALSMSKIDDENYKIYLNIPEVGNLTSNLQISTIINEDIEDIDVSDSVDINNLTESDEDTIMENFENTKAYELVTEIVQEFFYALFTSSDDEYYYNYDDEYYYDDYNEYYSNDLVIDNTY